ncbi:MAG: C1 family peptidase [Bacteroidia bacterium]
MKKKLHKLLHYVIFLIPFGAFGQNFVRIDMTNSKEVIHLAATQVLEVTLPSTPSTGYGWYLKDANSASFLKQMDESFESDTKYNPIGSSGITTIRFIPNGKGLCELEMVYKRIFEKESPLANYKISVNCEGFYNGSYSQSVENDDIAITEENSQITNNQKLRALPTSFTWQTYCTPAKNQGSCGACWAFCTTGSFEAVVNIWDKKVNDYSEQYLINCNTKGSGCNGGSSTAFNLYINPGAVAEAELPYKAKNGTCATYTHLEKAISYSTVKNITDSIKQAIYNYGPVYTAICSGSNLNNVGTGILTKSDGTTLNHAVLLVGWNDTEGYWIVKNSWGTSFASKGFFKAKYGVSAIGEGSAYINYKGIISHGNTTGIVDANNLRLTISPNPSTGIFTIKGLIGTNKIEVYDMVGRLVVQKLSENETQIIDLNENNKGVYIYKIINNNSKIALHGKLILN